MNTIGSYIDRPSGVHRLHPLIKNLMFVILFAICLMTNNPLLLGGIFIAVLAVGKAAELPIRQSLKTLKSVALLIVIFSLLIWPFTLLEGKVLFSVFGLKVYETGLLYGAAMTLRFCSIVLMSIYWMMFTSINEITLGFVKMGIPYKVAFSFSMSLRFVPLIMNDLRIIKEAQRSRALEMDKGSLAEKIRKNITILIPLSSRSLGLIKQISTCLEARGFESGRKRTSISDRPLSGRDITILAALILMLGIFIFLRVSGIGLITRSAL